MQIDKQDVFNTLKGVILEKHPDILPEKIARDASFLWAFNFDQYDLIEVIIQMEYKYKLVNNNITYMKQFTYIGEFCDNFYNILKEQKPELIKDSQSYKIPVFGFVKHLQRQK